jgi:hypothetical protein
MATPKWLTGTRKSWERIGFAKLSCHIASHNYSKDEYLEQVKKYINGNIQVADTSNLSQWLSINGIGTTDLQTSKDIKINIERQYWWIYNTVSKTGWISREAVSEYFEFLPRKIRILSSDMSLSEIGRLLYEYMMTESEKSVWEGTIISDVSPLSLTSIQILLFLYFILKEDGDFIIPLMEQWQVKFKNKEFNYIEAGNVIPETLDKIISRFRDSAYSNDDQMALEYAREVKAKIIVQRDTNVEKQGSGSRREQTSTPRLEWLVDFGILDKKGNRNYKFSENGTILVQKFIDLYDSLISAHYAEDCLEKLLNEHFYEISLSYINKNSSSADSIQTWELLKEGYNIIQGPSKYVLLRLLVLFVNGMQINKPEPKYIEYAQAFEVVKSEYRKNPKTTYYTVDQYGNDYQIKLTN